MGAAASVTAFEGDWADTGTAHAKLSATAPTDATTVDGTTAKTAGTGSRGKCPFGFVVTAKIINWKKKKRNITLG